MFERSAAEGGAERVAPRGRVTEHRRGAGAQRRPPE
jgi:hypothetical protein